MKTLLVIGGSSSINWYKLFEGAEINGEPVKVEHASWDDITLVSYSDSGCVITLSASKTPLPGTPQNKTIVPDFVLVRSATAGIYGQDYKNILIGLLHSRVPCINSVDSLLYCADKPAVYGKLREIQKRCKGENEFPLIPQTYYASWKGMTFVNSFPCVVKVGTAHSGFGKMRMKSMDEMEDFRSVVALQGRYVTCEPFIKWDYDFRIQKIGPHYRAFRRYSTNWKGKGMSQKDEDIEVTDKYKKWIDMASEALGMDICALDGVHSAEDDKEYIIELNDSAIGLVERHAEEDLQHIKDLVLHRMEQLFAKPASSDGSGSEPVVNDKSNEELIGVLQQRIKALELDKRNLQKRIEELEHQQNSASWWRWPFWR